MLKTVAEIEAYMVQANAQFEQLCGASTLEVLRSRPTIQLERMQVQLLAEIAVALVELNETLKLRR
jgi:hypothetical protein